MHLPRRRLVHPALGPRNPPPPPLIHYRISPPLQAHTHTIVLLNSFGIKCLSRREYALAVRVLEEVARRAVICGEAVSHQLPAYYCNLAEALFHSGDREKGMDVARRALVLADAPSFPSPPLPALLRPRPLSPSLCPSRKQYEDIKQHCRRFVADLERDYNKSAKSKKWLGWF